MSVEGDTTSGRLVLSDYVTLATELQACCRRMTTVSGAQKLERRIGTEIKFFQTLCRKDERTQAAQLQSSNLSHFAAIVHAATHLPGVTAVLRPFASSDRRHSLLVDVVADRGRSWVKVVARKGQALHLVWAGQGQYGERDMVQQLREYVQCVDHHLVNFRPPRVHVTFYNHVTMPMKDVLQAEGLTVWGRPVCVDANITHKLLAVREYDDDEECDVSIDYDNKVKRYLAEGHWKDDNSLADIDENCGHGRYSCNVVDCVSCLDGNVVFDGDEECEWRNEASVSDFLARSGCVKHVESVREDVTFQEQRLHVSSSRQLKWGSTSLKLEATVRGKIANSSLCSTPESLTQLSGVGLSLEHVESVNPTFEKSCNAVSVHCRDQTNLIEDLDSSCVTRSRAPPCPETAASQNRTTVPMASPFDKLETSDLETDSADPAEKYEERHDQLSSVPYAHPCKEATVLSSAWLLTQGHQCLARILAACPDYSAYVSESSVTASSYENEEGRGDWQGRVNLDITTLIALVSSVCHGSCHFRFRDKVLDEQAAKERQQPSLPGLQRYLQGRELIVCRTAWSDFNGIVQLLGGPTEQKRAAQLLHRVTIVDDQVSARAADLKLKGKIKERSKVVFGTGDQLQAVTVTANSGFVRAAESQGVSFAVYMHPARALTEQKESSAVPL